MTSLRQMTDAFCNGRPGKEAYDLLPSFLRAAPQEIEQFVDAVLEACPQGGTFLDAALSHISDEALERLVRKWISRAAAAGLTEATEALIAYASLQRPAALHPYLTLLFEMDANGCAICGSWPWREAPPESLTYLLAKAAPANEPAERLQALERLVETRHPAAFAACAPLAADIPALNPWHVYLEQAGFDADLRQLYTDDVAHLVFPPTHFPPPVTSWNLQGLHPSWHLPGTGSFRFGGPGSGTCGVCGGRLHHLLEIPEHRAGLSDRATLVALQACLSCLGWSRPVLHYRHGECGAITALDKGPDTPEFPAQPLRECVVALAPTPARWRWQDWALSNSRENLHRLGGHPTWVQSAGYPDCPCCSRKMRFILQLDSGLPSADGEEWLWGSGGVAYAFSCAPCRTTAYLWQCT
ncbi:hypothetical protein [Pseudoduganella sp.]|uniref:hypothetical protein n=1 Tax=Pseudoduganella sp. TaxID=1880898 RepID=UPI0035AE2CCD